jgi:hypothetical protein
MAVVPTDQSYAREGATPSICVSSVSASQVLMCRGHEGRRCWSRRKGCRLERLRRTHGAFVVDTVLMVDDEILAL